MPNIGLPSRYPANSDHKRSNSFKYGTMQTTQIGLPSCYPGSPDHKRSKSFEYGLMPTTQIGLPSQYPGSLDHERRQSFEYGFLLEELQDFDDVHQHYQLSPPTKSALNLVYSEDNEDKDNNDGNDNGNERESSLSIFQSDSNGRENDEVIDGGIPKTITIPTTIS